MTNPSNLSNPDFINKSLSCIFSKQEAVSVASLLEQTGIAPHLDLLFTNGNKNVFTMLGAGIIETVPKQNVMSEAHLVKLSVRLRLTAYGKEMVANAQKMPFESVVERFVERSPLDKLREKLNPNAEQDINEVQASEARIKRAVDGWVNTKLDNK